MGSITYNFLADSILFNENEINNQYKSLNDNQLENLLQSYREHCLNNVDDLTKEVTDNKSTLKVLSSIEKLPFETLKQSALYFDQFVIYDPLFKLTNIKSDSSDVMSEYLGYEKNAIDREQIVSTIKQLKLLTPMVASDFIKILPLSKAFEAPKEIPITLPTNHYADALPREIMNYCREKAIVKSMEQVEKGWKILENPDFTPGLYVTFEGIDFYQGQIYNYFLQEFIKTEDPKRFLTKLKLAEYPVNKDEWDIWKYQSINRSSKTIVDKIFHENLVANKLNATYLTDNSFTSDLLTKNLSSKETIETASATQFINMELPFLDKVDISKLMTIRENEAETFTNFRNELERNFRELRLLSDPKEIKLKQENIIHELGNIQVNKINQKLSSLKRKGFVDGVLLLGGLAGTVQTAGWSLLASALAVTSGYKNYREYKEKLTENPSYLLWKVMKK